MYDDRISQRGELGMALVDLFRAGATDEARLSPAQIIAANHLHCSSLPENRQGDFLSLARQTDNPELRTALCRILGFRWFAAPSIQEMLFQPRTSMPSEDLVVKSLLKGIADRLQHEGALALNPQMLDLIGRLPALLGREPSPLLRVIEVLQMWLGNVPEDGELSQEHSAEVARRMDALGPPGVAAWTEALANYAGTDPGVSVDFFEDLHRCQALPLLALFDPGRADACTDNQASVVWTSPASLGLLDNLCRSAPPGFTAGFAAEVVSQNHTPVSVLVELMRENKQVGFLDMASREAQLYLPLFLAKVSEACGFTQVALNFPPSIWEECRQAIQDGARDQVGSLLGQVAGFNKMFFIQSETFELLQQLLAITPLHFVPVGYDVGLTRGGQTGFEQNVRRLKTFIQDADPAPVLVLDIEGLDFDFGFHRLHFRTWEREWMNRSLVAGLVEELPEFRERIWCARALHESDKVTTGSVEQPDLAEICGESGICWSFGLRIRDASLTGRQPVFLNDPDELWQDHLDAAVVFLDRDSGGGRGSGTFRRSPARSLPVKICV